MDATFGRWLQPVKELEAEIDAQPQVTTLRRRVFLPDHVTWPVHIIGGEDVRLQSAELKNARVQRWIYYKTWESESQTAIKAAGRGFDVVFVHADGMRMNAAPCWRLDSEYMCSICPDLGGYIPDSAHLPEAVHAVMTDLHAQGKARGTFFSGMSLGGLTVLLAAASQQHLPRPDLFLGVYAFCPVVGMVAPPPGAIVIRIGRILSTFMGKTTFLAPTPEDNISDDPSMFRALLDDPLAITGKMRMASALAFYDGFTGLVAGSSSFKAPVCIAHGSHDRNTSHLASQDFIRRCGSADKRFREFEGYEHVMIKVAHGAIAEADVALNQAVLDDWRDWLEARIHRPFGGPAV